MKHATRSWKWFAIGTLAIAALTGWRSSADLLEAPFPSSTQRRITTELEMTKSTEVDDLAAARSDWPLIGGGLIIILSSGMVRSARIRNRKRRSERHLTIPLMTAMMQVEDAAEIPRRMDAPLPDEFQVLAAEMSEMIAEFEKAA